MSSFSFIGRILASLTSFGLIIAAAFTFNAVDTVPVNILSIFYGLVMVSLQRSLRSSPAVSLSFGIGPPARAP